MLYEFLFFEELEAVLGAAEEVEEVDGVEDGAVGIEGEGNVDVDSFDFVNVGLVGDEVDDFSFNDCEFVRSVFLMFLFDFLKGESQFVVFVVVE